VRDCSAYDIVQHDFLLLEKRAILSLEARLLGASAEKSSSEASDEASEEEKGE
jgi:hypothetical protein